MEKGIVIAAMAGVGKTCLAQKYKDIIDFDHLFFKYNYPEEVIKSNTFEGLKGLTKVRTKNPNWPESYISKLLEYIQQYKIVLIPSDREIVEYLQKENFEYILCYPNIESKNIYMERYKSRGTNEAWIEKMNQNFEKDVVYFASQKTKKLVLSGNETLEDKLKEMKII